MDLVPNDSRYAGEAYGVTYSPLVLLAHPTSHGRHESSIRDSGDTERQLSDTVTPAFPQGIRGVEAHTRRSADAAKRGFARVHYYRQPTLGQRIATGACWLFLVYAAALLLSACASVPVVSEELDDLGESLAASDAPEELIAEFSR